MEKFFQVDDEKLAGMVRDFEDMKKRVDDVFSEFAKKNGIEATGYWQTVDSLKIDATAKDKEKFGSQIKQDGVTFKKNSPLHKEWVELCKKEQLKTPYNPTWELSHMIQAPKGLCFRFGSRLFVLNGEVYGSFKTESHFELPDTLKEIKASEFWKMIEDYEESLKTESSEKEAEEPELD